MFFIILLICLILMFSSMMKNYPLGHIILTAITVFFVVLFCGFVTYTPDWNGYQIWIEQGVNREFFFVYVSEIINHYGLNYKHLHLAFITIYSLLMVLFINKFEKNPFPIVILYLSFNFLFYVTQIRFFLGYFSFILALYYYYLGNKKNLSYFLILFSFLNHYSVVLFFPFFYFFKFDLKEFDRKVLISNIFILVLYLFGSKIFSLIFGSVYGGYFKLENESSILGGIYFFLPAMMSYYFIYKIVRKKRNIYSILTKDSKFIFLYKLSFISFIYLGISFFIQIIGHRFIFPAVLFQIVLLLYYSRYNTKADNVKLYVSMFILYIFYMTYIYILPGIIFNENSVYNEAKKILNSNTILQYFK